MFTRSGYAYVFLVYITVIPPYLAVEGCNGVRLVVPRREVRTSEILDQLRIESNEAFLSHLESEAPVPPPDFGSWVEGLVVDGGEEGPLVDGAAVPEVAGCDCCVDGADELDAPGARVIPGAGAVGPLAA